MDSKKNSNNDSKKITIVLVLVLTLMLTTTGGTYAYLALSVNSTATAINGTVASGNLAFSAAPSLVAPTSTYSTKPLVPQYAYYNSKNVLQTAITGTTISSTKYPCVDGNGNAVCRVYSFTLQNNTTAAVVVSGTLTFSGVSTLPNLRWAPMSNATTVATLSSAADTDIHTASTTAAALTDASGNTSWSLAPGGANVTCANVPASCKQFWVVFWINETGNVQTDSGSWNVTVAFNSNAGGGITSTITTG